jgi:hybrid polyketide synthase/nonribosomal peptide synthetase ACE1
MIEKQYLALGNRVPEASAAYKIYKNISSILGGTLSPLEMMTEGGLLTTVYEQGVGQIGAYEHLRSIVDLAAHKKPRMNILEVGGGTGGTSNL